MVAEGGIVVTGLSVVSAEGIAILLCEGVSYGARTHAYDSDNVSKKLRNSADEKRAEAAREGSYDSNNYYKKGRPEGGNPREDYLERKDKRQIKSEDFKEFLKKEIYLNEKK